MEYISAEEFLKQPEDVQKVFIDWWKPEPSDIASTKDMENIECTIIGYIGENSYFVVDLDDFYKSVRTKNKIIPLFTEGQLRKFIEDKAGGNMDIGYSAINIEICIWENMQNKVQLIDTYKISTTNLLQAYWQVACKIAYTEVSNE